MLECELARKKDKKKRKRPLERDPLLAKKKKVRAKRTNKHSESEISPLNSTVQYDATDFDEPLAGDISTLFTIPPHDDQEIISFDISYDYVPLQSNEPEVNEENKTSKQPSVLAVKTDKSTQTKYDKYALCAKIENILRNEIKTLKSSQNKDISNLVAHEVVLASPEKSKYFIGLSPAQFWALYDFLGPAKFNLTYCNESKGYGKKLNHSISFQLFITLSRWRRGFNILTIAHWYGVSEYSIRTVFTTWIMFLFHHFKDHRYIMFPEQQEFKDTLSKLFCTFKNILVLVDCTEFKCEMPRNTKQPTGKSFLII